MRSGSRSKHVIMAMHSPMLTQSAVLKIVSTPKQNYLHDGKVVSPRAITVMIGDQRLEVTGRNPENNKLVLSDTAQLDADDEKKQAYDDSVTRPDRRLEVTSIYY